MSKRLEQKRFKANGLHQANQAEILRAHQRDDEFVRNLREQVIDLSYKFRGINFLQPILDFFESSLRLKFLYFLCTSALGNQTLGEEYTGIVQANLSARTVPSLPARILAMILEVFGEHGLIKLLERLKKSINNPESKLKPEAASFINVTINRLIVTLPMMILLHKSLFYLYGRYYSLGRRIAGVEYAKVYGKRPTDGVSWALRLLGVATLVQCALRLWRGEPTVEIDVKAVGTCDDNFKCQLCLDSTPTTVTPCGHLFCWNCLAEWVRVRGLCPSCREHVKPSRIVHLMNL